MRRKTVKRRKSAPRTARASQERLTYDQFRTGLTFREVRNMLWVHSDDPSDWKYKRRRTVLGFWHQLKQQLWARYLDERDADRGGVDAR